VIRRWLSKFSFSPFGRLARLEAKLDQLTDLLRQKRNASELEAKVEDVIKLLKQDSSVPACESELSDVVKLLREQHATQNTARVLSFLENEIRPLLVAVARDDAGHRRRLFAVREMPEYELAYTDPAPLVSVAISTQGNRLDLLMQRSLPSALAQTYPNLEVVVVGDAAGDATRAAIMALNDSRVRFFDLTQRFVHPNVKRHWLTAATLPRNEAYHQARGRWIADLDDDDALRPKAIERLLNLSREYRLEVAYGSLEQHPPMGCTELIPALPAGPFEVEGISWQGWHGRASCGALVHAGLRIFAREHVAADIGQPGDFFRVERMVRAGVRFGFLDEIVYDYYPSKLWAR
jgi:hypothetical protein